MKFLADQPAPFEPIPEQDRIHLLREFVDAPGPAIVNDLAGRIERQAVEPAERIDLGPMGADISVLQRDVIRTARLPAIGARTALEKSPALFQEFGQAGDRVRNPPRLVPAQAERAQIVARRRLAMMDPCDLGAVGVGDDQCL